MPVCVCPHCKTRLWVKDTQLNVAQGFVVCRKCEGLFQAKNHIAETPKNIDPSLLLNAVTDTKLVHSIGPQVRTRKTLSKHEIADLLDNMLVTDARNSAKAATAAKMKGPAQPAPAIPASGPMPVHMPQQEPKKDGFNWTLATLVALTVLIMQLFYLVLLLN
ncbi:hypothetical protein LVJ85_11655 [Neisseria sp. Dent CA1/247]|uniref:MJ0042-type zinc finger domain-containing protein n=1 Tax=Neisseria sp. Dent CA1/247 TaxID=2912675 RepID=UPI001FD4C039|nr:MJ0042-type zinc finger domain-containing protein [Neisseria sp. Dent CA1/247]UOO76644.1 hypothetical protein LVJ85_11655 [Neisseria sp. Dent CA1/247]